MAKKWVLGENSSFTLHMLQNVLLCNVTKFNIRPKVFFLSFLYFLNYSWQSWLPFLTITFASSFVCNLFCNRDFKSFISTVANKRLLWMMTCLASLGGRSSEIYCGLLTHIIWSIGLIKGETTSSITLKWSTCINT